MHWESFNPQYVVCENGNTGMSDSDVKAVANETSLYDANDAARSTSYLQGTATGSSGTSSQSTGAQGGEGVVDEVTARGKSVRDGSASANTAMTTSAESASSDSAAESGEVGGDGYWALFQESFDLAVKSIIRPPRSMYSTGSLGPKSFQLEGVTFRREDFSVRNRKGQNLV